MTEPNNRWRLINPQHVVGRRYFIIQFDDIRIADIFPDAGMYAGQS
jgi:hypothetical protein